MRAEVKREFVDRYTGELYTIGTILDVGEERLEEIRGVDAGLVAAVMEEAKVTEGQPAKKKVKKPAEKKAE